MLISRNYDKIFKTNPRKSYFPSKVAIFSIENSLFKIILGHNCQPIFIAFIFAHFMTKQFAFL